MIGNNLSKILHDGNNECYPAGPSKPIDVFSTQSGPGSIICPATLPPLTFDLKKKLNEGGILIEQVYFIKHWATYLWQVTEGKPTKKDYRNLSSAIVLQYPQLGVPPHCDPVFMLMLLLRIIFTMYN